MSATTDGEAEPIGVTHIPAVNLAVRVFRAFVCKRLVIARRFIDLVETELLALGFDPTLIPRGPTAAVLGLGLSALTYLFHKMVSR
jgi:hypothetical protein